MPTPTPLPDATLESLFAGWLERVEAGDTADLEELCREHPRHDAGLRALHRRWQELREVWDRVQEGSGNGGAPRSTENDPPTPVDFSSEVLARLVAKPPAATRYSVRDEVAHGGMGVVLRVWDEELRRHLAMKVMHARGAVAAASDTPSVDPRLLARFLEEAQITGQLDHPGIVPVHELGLDAEGRVYFTMKLVQGRTLREVFGELARGEGGWTQTRVLGLLQKVCEAMSYAHDKGVIHRDLKPSNVMVGRYGEVYVMDWGLAKVVGREDEKDIRLRPSEDLVSDGFTSERLQGVEDTPDSPLLTMDGDVIGTPAYMPPEQARGDLAAMGPHSDVYAVGAMLYHLLAGHMPYVPPGKPASSRAVWKRTKAGPPRPLSEVAPQAPQELVALCEKAMSRDVSRRYAGMSALSADLEAYVEGRVVRAYETGTWAEARKWVRRNTALASALAVAALTLFIGLVVTIYLLRRTNDALANFDSLALAAKLDEAERTSGEIYPVVPRNVAAMEAWLRDQWLPIEEDLASLRRTLERLRNRELEGADRFLWDTLVGLDARITEFQTLSARHVNDDIAWGRTVEEATVLAHARDWHEVVEAIAASPVYRGLQLPEQCGLIPLGPDPRSGLFEFYHLRSAAPDAPLPSRDPDSGRFRVSGDTGLIFVLLPGAEVLVGAQNDDPEGPNYDPFAVKEELGLRTAVIDPFFLSKFELTQGQWTRITATENRSEFKVGSRPFGGREITNANPLEHGPEQHSMRRHELRFPTEDEWEYACRAGTTTPWYTGSAPSSLVGYENLGDPSAGEAVPAWFEDDPLAPDGHIVHAPVGSFEPNPFGLHDMHGNVQEPCRAWSKDGRRIVLRGGTYRTSTVFARSSSRSFVGADHGEGFRPAREIRARGFASRPWPHDVVMYGSRRVVAGDVDSDGDEDLVGLGPESRVVLNDGHGDFQDVRERHPPFFDGELARGALGDVDIDGDLDLVALPAGDDLPLQNRLLLNDGSGRFLDVTSSHYPDVLDISSSLALGDLDNDGDPDLFVGNTGDDNGERNRVYRNRGDGRLSDVTDTALPALPPDQRTEDRTGALALGDLNADGHLDVVCGNWHYSWQNRVYLNKGDGCFADTTERSFPYIHFDRAPDTPNRHGDITLSMALGDVDGDGDLDLICGNGWGRRVQRDRLYFNDGTARFSDVSATHLPAGMATTNAIALSDIDGDDDLDLVSGNTHDRSRLYLNDGSGNFLDVTPTRFPSVQCSAALQIRDFDGDDDVDVLIGGKWGIRILFNEQR